MSIVTTLYDIIEAVSAECNDSDQVLAIVQELVNSGRVVLLGSSRRIQVVSLGGQQNEHGLSV